MKTVTIFGSSFPDENDYEYKFAYELGKALGREGFRICNGGFYGIMEATARGAKESGSNTIGITVGSPDLKANSYIDEEIRCKTLFERIDKLISLADCFIVLKGGTGTLLELSAILELINKNIIPKKPIVADKSFWNQIINLMNERNHYEGRNKLDVFLSEDVNEIVRYLKEKLEY